jgi:hypothetical protein
MQKAVYVAWFHVLSQHLARETNEKLVSMDGLRVQNRTRDPRIRRITNHTTSIIYFQTILVIYSCCASGRFQVSHNNNNTQPRLTPRSRLLEYCVDARHLAAHRATTSSSRATFKFRLFLGPPSYLHLLCFCIFWFMYIYSYLLLV